MKTKLLFLMTLLVVVACANAASLRQMQLEIVDEFWQPVTDITQISIFDAGTSSATTISSDRAGSLTMTNPITTGSTNSTFDQATGFVRWYQRAATYKVTITNGTKTLTIDNMNATFIRFPWFVNYIGTAASLSVNDNQSIIVGTDSDMTLAWNNGSDFMSWVPLSDGSAFNLGTSGTGANVDFNWFVGTALGIKGDEGAATLIIDGLTTSINTDSNFATNINTGTSTSAVTIGSSAAGNITIESTTTFDVLADDSVDISVSAGTITIDATGGDITVDATDKSLILRGTEEVGDAVVIHADGTAGGVDITSGTGDIVMVSTDDISMTVNNTTTDNIIITNTPGTAENAIDIDATAGGIDVDFATGKNMAVTGGQFIFTSNEAVASAFSVITNTGAAETITLVNTQGTAAGAITLTTTAAGSIDVNSGDNITIDVADDITIDTADGKIHLIADGSTAGDITLDAEDDIILTTTGKLTITNTEAVTISGALTVTGDTQLISVTRIDTPIEIVAATNEIEITESGTVYVLTNATEFVTTLPTVASSAGVTFRFIAGAVPSGDDYTVVTDSSENKINGSVIVNGASVIADGPDDTITFTRDAAVIGDWCELTSDGVLWYLSGMAHAATGIVPSGS